MHRRKITSTNKKKEDQKLRKAIKRGEAEPPPKPTRTQKRKKGLVQTRRSQVADDGNKLHSSFLRLSPEFLQTSLYLSASLPLQRPIDIRKCILELPDVNTLQRLTCPRRPPWNFDMSKKEVEKGEEGVFRKWPAQTDKLVQHWQDLAPEGAVEVDPPAIRDPDLPSDPPSTMPRSTTYFERNIEVWRQLWRVTEISQIILVLLDSRCPLLHYPPSLAEYLTLSKRKHILVLTKVDIAGPARVDAWTKYLQTAYPSLRIVLVESYAEKDLGWAQQGKAKYEPRMPDAFRHKLVDTIRELHEELLQPPEEVKSNPKRLAHWKPRIKTGLDWDAVHSARGNQVGIAIGGAAIPVEGEEDEEPRFLTVGVIGQPNVGKSSLLNALFGSQRVQASKTPGKTKHFQTLFWTPEVRLVDCPGLVMPAYVPMELQVLSGILPISRMPSIPSCIHFASELMPLEEVFKLKHPNPPPKPEEDKRTWRDPGKVVEAKPVQWTAMDVLSGYAEAKSWVTAQAGRLDVNRAGNAMLRAIAESRVSWALWPPGTDEALLSSEDGIWVRRTDGTDEEQYDHEAHSEDEHDHSEDTEGTSTNDDSVDESADTAEGAPVFETGPSRFAMLPVEDVEDEDEEESHGESEVA
ncbi:P-loop containing nucleoside triphosphate hydrolase protein [Cylindrobasidium torrendii FP15055 ss-10]|uniref:Guanine nucleotide-binding protein-like 1 n=1 Tax=Cylindrobasidium torrendii FP15055 ss-10 TaxID=1314674 RepID=A0A0D7BAG1_9AGAR|nr:P-loop containing nucleoside triphosphate hydrolase protein [Cylindrobasidium torrendii FP15055 ss-10]